MTSKHIKGRKGEGNGGNNKNCKYCNNEYSTLHGLRVHQNKCKVRSTTSEQILIEHNTKLMEANNDLTKQIIEICANMKQPIHNNNITNNSNTNNQTFNLNFFLNETCKDAMSLSAFVSSIQLQLNELEETGRLGYCNGISNIIINNLKKLQLCERPVHCTDVKRETMYVKNESEWQKDANNEQLTNAINCVSNKNCQNIIVWRDLHPDCSDYNSLENNQFLGIVSNAMAGSTTDEIQKNVGKVIKNIAREVIVGK
jgi:hypothetical protein